MEFSQKKITISFAMMLAVFGMGMLHVSNLDDFSYKIIPGAFAQENKVDEDWLVYDNPEKGITVQYPKNWDFTLHLRREIHLQKMLLLEQKNYKSLWL